MKKSIILLLLFISIQSIPGKIKLPGIFSNDMVLQQNTTVKIWGWGNPGEKVTVKAEWMKSPVAVITGADGKWLVKLKTVKAGGPYTITLSGENEIVLNNVLLGEVWVCSGQSNMEYTIKMLGGWDKYFPAEKEDLTKNGYQQIRLCQVTQATSAAPMDTCKANWIMPGVESVENFSATAYFYGRELYNALKTPIGLISTNWGGTPAEAWTEISYLEKNDELKYYLSLNNSNPPNQPAKLFNAMINPLVNYTIKGAIWYQGEANVDNADRYNTLLTTMIKCWRDKWHIGDFPFYFVQIAPYNYGDDANSSAFLREAQTKTLSTAKNTGMAVTMDIGNIKDIHPKNKQEVGKRLALWALAKTYKANIAAYSGPLYKNFVKEGNKIRIFFDYAGKGLTVKGNKLTGFTIADNKMNFISAEAVIDKNTVLVYNKDITNPSAVRFAFTDTDTSNLFNKDNLPATSFRTDKIPFYKPDITIIPALNIEKSVIDVNINCADSKAEIHYTTDGTEPAASSPKYEKSLSLDKSSQINARAFKNGVKSLNTAGLKFDRHEAFGKKVTYKELYASKYSSTKDFALTDGIRGSSSFNDGLWQGFKETDFEVVIDLGEIKTISQISAGFLKAISAHIFPPRKVEFYISEDGINFIKKFEITNIIPSENGRTAPETYTANIAGAKTRFVKVYAQNQGTCPDWHSGKGSKAWLFADEIIVK